MNIQLIENASENEKQQTCAMLIANLPSWFDHKESNIREKKAAKENPGIIVKDNNSSIGFIGYQITHDHDLKKNVLKVNWLGLLEKYHRHGIGKNLINRIIEVAITHEAGAITLITLGQEAKNEAYLKTFAFYKSFGFKVYRRSKTGGVVWLKKEL